MTQVVWFGYTLVSTIHFDSKQEYTSSRLELRRWYRSLKFVSTSGSPGCGVKTRDGTYDGLVRRPVSRNLDKTRTPDGLRS